MTEFRSIRVHAIVLRHADWGEADRLVTLFTREQGKLRAIVKGARKITSRKAGHLEPFTHVKLQLARGRSLFIVTQADTIDAYLPLRETLVMTGTASYVVELLDRFVYEDEGANPTLFRLLADTLKRLANRRGYLAGCPLLRDAPAGLPRFSPATLRMRQLRTRDQSRRPVLLVLLGRRHLSALRARAAQPGWHLGGCLEIPASLPAQQLC